ncbi:MAG: hypothetical protein LBU86_00765, partial [Oscillospiraceae bacterium]|nr:hypothetical protein [Oscillospiraceae bacterium]
MDDICVEALTARFDPDLRGSPYEGDREYTRDLMCEVSLCLVGAVACRAACAEAAGEGEAPGHPGFAMSGEEAEGYLANYPNSLVEPSPELAGMLLAAREHMASRLEATARAGIILRAERLRELLALSGFGFFAVCCALASAVDRGFERLFAQLHGDTVQPFPTLGAVLACYELSCPKSRPEWRELLDPSAGINRLVLMPEQPDRPPLARAVALRPNALSYLLGSFRLSGELADCGGGIIPSAQRALFLEGQIDKARTALSRMANRDKPRLCVLCGEAGSGRRLALAKAAEEEGAELLLVRLDELSTAVGEAAESVVDEIVSAALFWGLIPCFYSENAAESALFKRLLRALGGYRIGVVLLTSRLRGSPGP